MKNKQRGSVGLIVLLIAIIAIIGGIYYASATGNLIDIQYKKPNTLIKNEILPKEIKDFYTKYNGQNFGDIADMYDTESIKNNFNSKKGLIEYLKFYREAYGENKSYTLMQTHKAVNNDNQLIYEVKATYQNVTPDSNDTFVILTDKVTGKITFKNYSPGVSNELR